MIAILHLITSLDAGGSEAMLARLVTGMDRARFSNRVVSLLPAGALAARIRSAGIPVESLELTPGRPSVLGLLRLLRILRQVRPDILQSWLYHADLLGLLAGRLARVRRVAWNIRCGEMELAHAPRLTAWTFRACALLSRLPDAIVANAESGIAAHVRRGFCPRRFVHIPNGFEVGRFAPDPEEGRRLRGELGVAGTVPLIGLAARFDPLKDHRTFLRASAAIRVRQPSARFLLCGRGTDPANPRLRQWLDEAGCREAFLLLGHREDVPRIMNALDVAVSSSIGEGFPNVLGEAMACGTPCVATDVGDSAVLLGGAGRLVPAGDPAALAEAVLELLSLPAPARAALKAAARARIVERYALPGIVARYEAFYRGIVDDPSAGCAT